MAHSKHEETTRKKQEVMSFQEVKDTFKLKNQDFQYLQIWHYLEQEVGVNLDEKLMNLQITVSTETYSQVV